MSDREILTYILHFGPATIVLLACIVLPGLKGRRLLFLTVCVLANKFVSKAINLVIVTESRVVKAGDPMPIVNYKPLLITTIAVCLVYYIFQRARQASFEQVRQSTWANLAYFSPLVLLFLLEIVFIKLLLVGLFSDGGFNIKGVYFLIPWKGLHFIAFLVLIVHWWRAGTLCPTPTSFFSKTFRILGLVFSSIAVLALFLTLGLPFLAVGSSGAGVFAQMSLWIGSLVVEYTAIISLATFEIARWISFSSRDVRDRDKSNEQENREKVLEGT